MAIAPAVMLLAACAAGATLWIVRRRRRGAAPAPSPAIEGAPGARPPPPASTSVAAPAPSAVLDSDLLEHANLGAARRLWALAFASPSQSQASELVNRRVRGNVDAMLSVDTLDPKYFPRRPALLPQLMQAMDDPSAASDKLSRIIAHDPVLTADVLKLANSSLYRTSTTPIETIQRAIVVCGVDALRGMLAAALLRPVFRATRKNFPRLPRMLWERTERAARAAELFALATSPADRFEAQLVVLLSSLGPLAVYGAALDVYARNPHFSPNGDLCVELIVELAPRVSLHVARDWQCAPRLLAALERDAAEPLNRARQVGELIGTLAFLESQTVIAREERLEILHGAGIPADMTQAIWVGLTGTP